VTESTVIDRPVRPVVTGIGVVAPNGIGTDRYWKSTLGGATGIGRITRFDPTGYPVTVAGEVGGFDSAEHVPSRLRVQTDLWTHFGLAATVMALDDASISPTEWAPYDLAVITASSSGGNLFGQREIESLWSKGPEHVTAYQSIAWFYAATTGQISIRHGMKGPCGVVVAEQAGGLDALGLSRRALRSGSRVVVTGGTEAPVGPYALTCQIASGLLSTDPDPATAFRPFAPDSTGHVPGEGGAILVVEDLADAQARGARIYGEVTGYAAGFDPPPGTDRPPAVRRTVEAALADANVRPEDVDVVFADAAGTPAADAQETAAISAIFGHRGVPVAVPKTMTGRLYAGGAPLDVTAALLALRDEVIPPSVGGRLPDTHPLDVVDRPREGRVTNALVIARGFGGFTAAVVLAAVD
jgi:act minimal PKS chain-length factor (CLF/KS beta)